MNEQKDKGCYHKFNVSRVDGRDMFGGDRQNADYIVLDLTYDKYAAPALLAYAKAVAKEYPKLSQDILNKYFEICNDCLGTGKTILHFADNEYPTPCKKCKEGGYLFIEPNLKWGD